MYHLPSKLRTACSLCLLYSSSILATLHPSSSTEINDNQCRLNLFQAEQMQSESDLQLALITDKLHRQRYIAMQAGINHASGFENIKYYRSGHPVEIFSANWRKQGSSHSIARLVMQGGASDKQAFDIFTQLVQEDDGHFEINTSGSQYHFIAEERDLQAFLDCLEKQQQ